MKVGGLTIRLPSHEVVGWNFITRTEREALGGESFYFYEYMACLMNDRGDFIYPHILLRIVSRYILYK